MRAPAFAIALAACSAKEPAPAAPPPLVWEHDETAAFTRARGEHKAVLIEFSASWCVPCEQLDRELHAESIASAIRSSFVPLLVDVSEQTDAVAAIRARYRVETLPATVLISTDGTVLERITKLIDETELATVLHRAASRVSSP